MKVQDQSKLTGKLLEQSDPLVGRPQPPPMQIITKGWWLQKPDKYATAEELEEPRHDKR